MKLIELNEAHKWEQGKDLAEMTPAGQTTYLHSDPRLIFRHSNPPVKFIARCFRQKRLQDSVLDGTISPDFIKQYFSNKSPEIVGAAMAVFPEITAALIDLNDKEAVKNLLLSPNIVIDRQDMYEILVRYIFRNNQLQMKRWIDYGEDLREEM